MINGKLQLFETSYTLVKSSDFRTFVLKLIDNQR